MIELNRIYTGDCIDVMKTSPENFVDTIITDPPYGIRFMGKAWDGADIEKTTNSKRRVTPRNDGRGYMSTENRAWAAGTYDFTLTGNHAFQAWSAEWAAAALKIVKPGGLMLVFGGTRTFHRMAAGIEDAGWQIRDCLMWLYGSGFPKSLDISKAIDRRAGAEREVIGYKRQGPHSMFDGGKPRPVTQPVTQPATLWNGWGTALKPACEPIIVAMKPVDGTFAENAEKWGVAGMNIDGSRIATCAESFQDRRADKIQLDFDGSKGRWPANLILDEEAAGMLDGQSEASCTDYAPMGRRQTDRDGKGLFPMYGQGRHSFGDSGGASRFFYVAKADRVERNEGCDSMPQQRVDDGRQKPIDNPFLRGETERRNTHPTVKPLDLMKYLCNLTRTPTGGIVLDPFAGSGTTLWAAEYHNRPWIGIEMNAEYVAIANARIARERSQLKMAI